jgi:hypothetical protein
MYTDIQYIIANDYLPDHYFFVISKESGSYCSELGLLYNLLRGAVYMIHTFFYFLLLKFNKILFNCSVIFEYEIQMLSWNLPMSIVHIHI